MLLKFVKSYAWQYVWWCFDWTLWSLVILVQHVPYNRIDFLSTQCTAYLMHFFSHWGFVSVSDKWHAKSHLAYGSVKKYTNVTIPVASLSRNVKCYISVFVSGIFYIKDQMWVALNAAMLPLICRHAVLHCRWLHVWVTSLPLLSVQSDDVRQRTTELST